MHKDGASAVEYALMAALAVVIFGGAFAAFSDLLLDFFSNFIDNINPF
jgi:Flp pilus assembly pilin Flp